MNNTQRKFLSALCAAMLIGTASPYAGFAAKLPVGVPGTRVVPVTLPSKQVTYKTNKKHADVAVKKNATVQQTKAGFAAPSLYSVPNADKALQERGALVWTQGVLGGNRSDFVNAPELFKGLDCKESDVTKFLVLRETLYTATTWMIGQAQFKKDNVVVNPDGGMKVEFSAPDLTKNIETAQKDFAERFRISQNAARVIAEWYVSSQINTSADNKLLHDVQYADMSRIAPINMFGRVMFGGNELKQLLEAPERDAVEAISAVKTNKLAWAEPYVKNIEFIVKWSNGLSFSSELREVLNK